MLEISPAQRQVMAELCRRHGVRSLHLFGSATSNRFNPQASDIDLAVDFGDAPVEGYATRYFNLLNGLQDLFGRPVDLIEWPAITNPYFRREIEETRLPLYAA